METCVKTFGELPNIDVSEDPCSVSGADNNQDSAVTVGKGMQAMRSATQATGAEGDSLMIAIMQNSPQLKRLISGCPQGEENVSVALEDLKKALQEVERAGQHLQDCVAAQTECGADQSLEHENCQKEREAYKKKCADLSDCERKLSQQYESEIKCLDKDMEKLQKQKACKDDQAHTAELERFQELNLQHMEETKDLQHTIKVQARYSREQDAELEELKSMYAEKEREVAELREELERKEGELEELYETVKEKERYIETTKKRQKEDKEFTTSELVTNLRQEKRDIQEKLEKCKGIDELVSRLPNVKSQEERDEITRQVMSNVEFCSRTHSTKKTKSWHYLMH